MRETINKSISVKKNVRVISWGLMLIFIFGMPFMPINSELVIGSSYAETDASGENSSNDENGVSTSPPAVTTPKKINTVQIGTIKNLSYNGKKKKPAVRLTDSGKRLVQNKDYTISYKNNKNPGTAIANVIGKGDYYGTKKIKFKIVINAPKKIKVKKNQKNITVSWRKVSSVTGYKVYFSSNRKFTKKKKVKYIKSRKKTKYSISTPVSKRTYYVKIRAYKVINGKKYYSKASVVKKLKTKNQKWIEVSLKKQKIYLKIGKKKIKTYVVSTGKKKTPTIKGTFYIYRKNPKHDMIGRMDPKTKKPEYIQKNVLWATYFIGGYAFHATYWHKNFGHPMSHGCINMRTNEAKFLYKWTPMGTRVVVHN